MEDTIIIPETRSGRDVPTPSVPVGRQWVWIWLAAVVLCVAVGGVVYLVQSAWLKTHSQVPDPATYTLLAIRAGEAAVKDGRWTVAWNQIVHNSLNPLRMVPLVLLAPRALMHSLGHLCTTVPMLFAFVSLLGITVFRRSGSFVYACGCMMAGCAVPGFYNGTWGLGAFWLDLPASFPIAAAALALLNSDRLRRLGWVVLAAMFISWAALSRYVAGVFAFFVCGPVIAGYFIARIRSGECWKMCLKPLALMGAIVVILDGWFVAGHYATVSAAYATYGFGNQGPWGSFQFTVASVAKFMSIPFLAVLAATAGARALLGSRTGRDAGALLVQWWFPIAVVVFLTVSCQVGEAAHGTFYAVPLTILAALVPTRSAGKDQKLLVYVGVGLAAVSLYLAAGVARSTYLRGKHPAPIPKAVKEAELALGRSVAGQGPALRWMAYFEECDPVVTVETFVEYGILLQGASRESHYTMHRSYWEGDHPGRTPQEVAGLLLENAKREIDVAVIPADPARAIAAADNDYSREAIRAMAEKLPQDPEWKRVFEVEHPRYGLLFGYRNQRPSGVLR